MKKENFVLGLFVILVGCVSAPVPSLEGDVLVISGANLAKYWVPKNEAVRFSVVRVALNFKPPAECGFVILQYIIDSNGDVFNAKIVESVPPRTYDRAALKALSLREFQPSPTNAARVPVQVTTKTTFNAPGSEC